MTPDIDTELARHGPACCATPPSGRWPTSPKWASRPAAPPGRGDRRPGRARLRAARRGPGLRRGPSPPLTTSASQATMASGGPRYFGFVIGAALPVAQAAAWLGAAWDQNGGRPSTARPLGRGCTRVALRRLRALFGLPAETAAAFVTGATVANFTAWPRPGTRCFTRQAGTSKPRACSARRRSPSSPARKRTRRCSRRSACRARAAGGALPVDGQGRIGRAGCRR